MQLNKRLFSDFMYTIVLCIHWKKICYVKKSTKLNF